MSPLTQDVQSLQHQAAPCAAQRDALERELDTFTHAVSHDLRAPVWAVDGLARILQEEYLDRLPPDAQRFLQLLRHNTQQLGRQIENLLALVWAGRQPMYPQTLALADLARQAWDDLADPRAGRQAELRIGDMPPCRADPALLRHALLNLLSNSLKFTRSRPQALIEIGWENAAYFVRDNGVGFDMACADKLFGVFQRLHPPDDYPGAGLGLAVVQRIIHRHGGQVSAHANLDEGAVFRFTLPGE